MAATCPHCEALITSMTVNAIEARDPNGKTWKAATFACGSCGKAIGAAFDAVAQTAAIVQQIKRGGSRWDAE